jgi:hypothetical protein
MDILCLLFGGIVVVFGLLFWLANADPKLNSQHVSGLLPKIFFLGAGLIMVGTIVYLAG